MRRRLEEAGEAYDEAQRTREELVVEAWQKKGGIREIADACGMSHTGVAKLLERLGVRRRLSYDEMDRARREQDGER